MPARATAPVASHRAKFLREFCWRPVQDRGLRYRQQRKFRSAHRAARPRMPGPTSTVATFVLRFQQFARPQLRSATAEAPRQRPLSSYRSGPSFWTWLPFCVSFGLRSRSIRSCLSHTLLLRRIHHSVPAGLRTCTPVVTSSHWRRLAASSIVIPNFSLKISSS